LISTTPPFRKSSRYHWGVPKVIQIRNVPDHLHRTLKARAATAGLSLSDYLLKEIASLAEMPTREEWARRLDQRTPVKVRGSIAAMIRAERRRR
jgi:antitoxin FitA